MMELYFSQHSLTRIARRNLKKSDVYYVMLYGKEFHRSGAWIYFLRRKDIPGCDQVNDRRVRLAGTAVVCAKDGRTIITAWRNPRKGLGNIKRKPQYGKYAD
jgi:hypothetical protein